ncbi:DoxX family protein [Rhizobiaceae bacterium n13]|uniref:DoxX family protein n=1 Tax=Ferirhizobium litorale TaxID=2927786 RepID=A0AAE3QKN5_9HYPH|nr:DoxX family protein [Fererhizobium litorale]MDI7864525.1 DoxX family protein [Fererhizobium litorale]MDI7924934.1 DoxX family protein [Fererhizobium litorale]
MADQTTSARSSLVIPALSPLYAAGTTGAETLLRVLAGVLFAVHGFGKIINPFGAVGMVESLGFYPGVFWSPLLAATEFFGGILLAIGLLTRPAAVAATIVLLVTVYSHWVVKGEGLGGAERSILWSAITFYFAFRGGNAHSLDARIGKQF